MERAGEPPNILTILFTFGSFICGNYVRFPRSRELASWLADWRLKGREKNRGFCMFLFHVSLICSDVSWCVLRQRDWIRWARVDWPSSMDRHIKLWSPTADDIESINEAVQRICGCLLHHHCTQQWSTKIVVRYPLFWTTSYCRGPRKPNPVFLHLFSNCQTIGKVDQQQHC